MKRLPPAPLLRLVWDRDTDPLNPHRAMHRRVRAWQRRGEQVTLLSLLGLATVGLGLIWWGAAHLR